MNETLEGLSCLVKLYAQVFYVIFYPTFVLSMILYLNLGVLSWLLIGALLLPPVAVWYVIVRNRLENYLKLLKSSHEWNIEKSLAEYAELTKASKKEQDPDN